MRTHYNLIYSTHNGDDAPQNFPFMPCAGLLPNSQKNISKHSTQCNPASCKIHFKVILIQGAAVNWAILQHCYFWFSNTGADAAIAILLPTLNRFSCNGAVDWSTTCFCCESVFQKRWQFCDRSAWISNRVRVTQSGNAQNGVDLFQWPLSLPQYSRVYVLFLHYHLSSLVSNQ